MWSVHQGRCILPLILAASVALAKDHDPVVRDLFISDHPRNATDSLYVTGGVVTVIRFEQPCIPDKTKLLGWEGRFEPLVCAGKRVLLEPLRDLARDEQLPMIVTLADGAEIPFLVVRRLDMLADQQVNVFKNRESHGGALASLAEARDRARVLEEENERLHTEEKSVDHALATLLLGAAKQTLFHEEEHWRIKDSDVDLDVRVFSGKAKAAAVFTITNRDPERSWSITETRLMTLSRGANRELAMRSAQSSIPPGKTGTIAIIVDKSAFASDKGVENLALEIFRHDGRRQVLLVLDSRLAR